MRTVSTNWWQRAVAGCAGWLLIAAAANADTVAQAGARSDQGAAGILKVIGAYPEERGLGHTVTALAGGKVLVYGHSPGAGAIDSVPLAPRQRTGEAAQLAPLLWDPQQRGWKHIGNAPECTFSHYLHTATALASGKVLIAGGLCDAPLRHANVAIAPPYRALSLWNETSQAWEKAPQLAEARIYHSATLLADDGVLLVGGESDRREDTTVEPVLASAELWRAGKLSSSAPMLVARAKHSATRLADGSVLVAGGIGRSGKAISFVERWDPATQRWSDGPALKSARFLHSATLLADGRLMVAGGVGLDGKALNSVEILDAARTAWSDGAPLLLPLHRLAAQTLASGDVLVIGTGSDGDHPYSGAMLWDRSSAQWRPAGRPFSDRFRAQQSYALAPAAPQGNAVLVFDYRLVMRWSPSTQGPTAASAYGERSGYTSTVLKDGRVMLAAGRVKLFGGAPGETGLDWAELYDPAGDRFALTGRLNQPKVHPIALALGNGGAVVADVGTTVQFGPNAASVAEVWSPETGRWSAIEGLTVPGTSSGQLEAFGQLEDGRVLFFLTGYLERETPHYAKIWNPRDNTLESIPVTIKGVAAAVAPTGRVLIVAREYTDDLPLQVWDSRSGAIEVLPMPDGGRIHLMDSLLLKNGNVVVLHNSYSGNARGAQVAVWVPASGRLQPLPALPEDLKWDSNVRHLVELSDGTLATDGYRLRPDAPAWTAAPPFPQADAHLLQLPSGRLMALSASAPHAALLDLATSDWRIQASHFLRRKENMAPALLELNNGQLMVAGSFDRAGWPQETTIQLWDRAGGSWSDAGKPLGVYVAQLQAARLPSGQVMLLGRDRDGNLGCEIGHPRDQRWSACGPSTPVKYGNVDFSVGTLEDGRVALMFGQSQVYAYSEQARQWTTLAAPLPAIVGGGSGVSTRRFPLPDGCFISGPPFRIFNPSTQTETALTMVTGVKAERTSMAVLADGTVVLAGYPDGADGLGHGFFHRKATCAGFAALADDDAFMPGTAVAAATAPAVATSAGQWWSRLAQQIGAAKWWLLAALGAGSAYCLHRRERQTNRTSTQAETGQSIQRKEPLPSARGNARSSRSPAAPTGPRRPFLYLGVGIVIAILLMIGLRPPARSGDQPCRFVGVWLSSRSGSDITLNADGSYITPPVPDQHGQPQIYHGKWKVAGDKLVWTHFGKETVTEANPIREESDGHFTLIEESGDRTRFTLQKTVETARCKP
jgi:hypothetical protein